MLPSLSHLVGCCVSKSVLCPNCEEYCLCATSYHPCRMLHFMGKKRHDFQVMWWSDGVSLSEPSFAQRVCGVSYLMRNWRQIIEFAHFFSVCWFCMFFEQQNQKACKSYVFHKHVNEHQHKQTQSYNFEQANPMI